MLSIFREIIFLQHDQMKPRVAIPIATKDNSYGKCKTYDGPIKRHPIEAIKSPVIIIFLFDIQLCTF